MNDDLLNNLKKIKDLYDSGAITKEEFEKLKSEYMRNETINIQHKKPVDHINHSKDEKIASLYLFSLILGAIPCVFWGYLGHYVFFPISSIVVIVLLIIGENLSKKMGYKKVYKSPLYGCAIASCVIYVISCILFLYFLEF